MNVINFWWFSLTFDSPETFSKATATRLHTRYSQYYIVYTLKQNNVKDLIHAKQWKCSMVAVSCRHQWHKHLRWPASQCKSRRTKWRSLRWPWRSPLANDLSPVVLCKRFLTNVLSPVALRERALANVPSWTFSLQLFPHECSLTNVLSIAESFSWTPLWCMRDEQEYQAWKSPANDRKPSPHSRAQLLNHVQYRTLTLNRCCQLRAFRNRESVCDGMFAKSDGGENVCEGTLPRERSRENVREGTFARERSEKNVREGLRGRELTFVRTLARDCSRGATFRANVILRQASCTWSSPFIT